MSSSGATWLQSLGAIPTTYGPGLPERVAALAEDGVHAAVDIAGSGVIPDLVSITGTAEKVVSISDFQAPKYGVRTLFEDKDSTPALQRVAKLFVSGEFTLPVERTFTLEEVSAAHELSAQGHVTGRLIITICGA